MKLMEYVIYSGLLFVGSYTIITVALRVFDVTTIRNAHMIGGIVGTFVGVLLFVFLLLRTNRVSQ